MGGSPSSDIRTSPSAIRGSATVSAWTLVSRVTGLGRVISVGAVLGPTFLANAFVATNTVPALVFLAIAGTVLSSVIVPSIVRTIACDGTQGATELLGRLAGFLILLTSAAAVPLILMSPWIARLLTFGIDDAASRAQFEHLAAVMLIVVAPQLILYMVASLGAAAQQARGRFALAAAAPAVENIGVMTTVATAGWLYAGRIESAETAMSLAILLCSGTTLSVGLHMALQLFGASRVGLPIRPCLRRAADFHVREVKQRIRQSLVVAVSPELAYFALMAVAGTVPGGVLLLQLAYSVYSLPAALGARAISMAVLPGLSEAAYRKDSPLFIERIREGLAYTFVASLPLLILMAVFSLPIADFLANGRLRVGELIYSLAACILVLAAAQLPAGLYEIGRQALFARLDVRGPRVAALVGLGATVITALAVFYVLSGPSRLVGLSVAVLINDALAAVTVLVLVRRVVREEPLIDRRRVGAAAVAATVILPVVAGGWVFIDVLQINRVGNLVIVGLTAVLALGLFALTLHAGSGWRHGYRHPG